MLLLRRSGEHAKRYSQAGSRGYRRSRQGDERRPIIRAEAHMLQGQTGSRSRILHCPADLIAPAISMMPVFHEVSRAEGPSQQGRKTTTGSGLRTRGQTGLAANFQQNAPEIHARLVRFEKPPRGVGSEPGDRQDWQRISGKMRRKSMPVLSVPGARVGGDEVSMAVFHELSRAEGPSQQGRWCEKHERGVPFCKPTH